MAITAIRTVIIYIFIITAMRIMGKRQLGELQPVELVVTLLISDLAAVPMQESGMPLLNGSDPHPHLGVPGAAAVRGPCSSSPGFPG